MIGAPTLDCERFSRKGRRLRGGLGGVTTTSTTVVEALAAAAGLAELLHLVLGRVERPQLVTVVGVAVALAFARRVIEMLHVPADVLSSLALEALRGNPASLDHLALLCGLTRLGGAAIAGFAIFAIWAAVLPVRENNFSALREVARRSSGATTIGFGLGSVLATIATVAVLEKPTAYPMFVFVGVPACIAAVAIIAKRVSP